MTNPVTPTTVGPSDTEQSITVPAMPETFKLTSNPAYLQFVQFSAYLASQGIFICQMTTTEGGPVYSRIEAVDIVEKKLGEFLGVDMTLVEEERRTATNIARQLAGVLPNQDLPPV